jgi:hypothetical protein
MQANAVQRDSAIAVTTPQVSIAYHHTMSMQSLPYRYAVVLFAKVGAMHLAVHFVFLYEKKTKNKKQKQKQKKNRNRNNDITKAPTSG